jgi:hypothetical protein
MAEIQALSLTNKDSTTNTFDVQHKSGFTALWALLAASSTALREKVKLSMRAATSKVDRRVESVVTVPYEAQVNGITVTKYVSARTIYLIPDDAPVATSEQLVARNASLSAEAVIASAVKDGAFPY